jgi:hypothetical protein
MRCGGGPELVQAVGTRLSHVCCVCTCGEAPAKLMGSLRCLLEAVPNGADRRHVKEALNSMTPSYLLSTAHYSDSTYTGSQRAREEVMQLEQRNLTPIVGPGSN